MFSFIIVLIAILIAVIVAGVAYYYGGSAYTNAGVAASAAKAESEITQVTTAVHAYAADNQAMPANTQALVTAQYLTSVPDARITFEHDFVDKPVDDADICQNIDLKMGLKSIPSCDDPVMNSSYSANICCQQSDTTP